MPLVIKFYFTSSVLDMFRTSVHPSSGACDFSIVSPHWSCVLVSMCIGSFGVPVCSLLTRGNRTIEWDVCVGQNWIHIVIFRIWQCKCFMVYSVCVLTLYLLMWKIW